MPSSATSTLQRALALLAEVAAAPTLHLDDEELCALAVSAEEAGRLVDATRFAAAAEIDHRSRFELGSDGLAYKLGHRRGIHLVEQLTRVSQTEAVRRVRVGAALRPRLGLGGELLPPEFPGVAAAVASGAVGMDAAAVVTRCLGQAARNGADPEHVAAAESDLVAEAHREPADSIAVMARAWREALDSDGALPREEKLRNRRSFVLSTEREGMVRFHGAASPIEAAELKAYFSESTAPDAQPRFLSEEDRARAATDSLPGEEAVRDPRTREQRQFDIVMGLLRAGVRSTGQGATATVTAVIKLSDLETARASAGSTAWQSR